MIGLDTNVLVRLLTEDDPAQAAKARSFVERTLAGGDRLFVGAVVLAELAWVLSSAYRYGKADVALALEALLSTEGFEVEGRDAAREALDRYRAGKGDFADHLIGVRNAHAGCESTFTFDRGLASAPGFRLR